MATEAVKVDFIEAAAPATPGAGVVRTYSKADGLMYSKDDAGTETLMSSGASSGIPATIFDVAGDIIVASAADTAARLGVGAEGDVLTIASSVPAWAAPAATTPTFAGARADLSGAQSIANTGEITILWDAEDYDTNAFHFTSAANLTGTVAKTAANANIVGTGTAFTTELAVNQVISIPGTAAEIGVVKAITDDTHLELWQTMANNATGQTATRKNEYMAIPAGMAGYFDIRAAVALASATVGNRYLRINAVQSGTEIVAAIVSFEVQGTRASYGQAGARIALNPGDYVWARALQASTTNPLALNLTGGFCFLEIDYRGA